MILILSSFAFTVHKSTKRTTEREFDLYSLYFPCGLVKHVNPKGSVEKDHVSFSERSRTETTHKGNFREKNLKIL